MLRGDAIGWLPSNEFDGKTKALRRNKAKVERAWDRASTKQLPCTSERFREQYNGVGKYREPGPRNPLELGTRIGYNFGVPSFSPLAIHFRIGSGPSSR